MDVTALKRPVFAVLFTPVRVSDPPAMI